MEWFTKVNVERRGHNLAYSDRIFCLGSCFAQYFGERMSRDGFRVANNPLGILYNPASLSTALRLIMEGRADSIRAVEHEGIWRSFLAHGSVYSNSEKELEKELTHRLQSAREGLQSASQMIVTFGSAHVWRLKESGEIVANCHKLPGTLFDRDRLSPGDIQKDWQAVLDQLLEFNPQLRIDLTVSPVRHLRDGLVENNRSKGALLLAASELVFANDRVEYFPSYEILMDELRDYRWYARDLAHPSDEALDYIIDRYLENRAKPKTLELRKQVRKLVRKWEHRHIHPESAQARKFKRDLEEEMAQFTAEHPEIIFETIIKAQPLK